MALFNTGIILDMISVNHIKLSFSEKVLFDDISFLITPRDRIGLVGNNGSGKTTLLKIILGLQAPDSGIVEKPAKITIGYLPQQMKHVDNKSLFNEVKTAFDQILELKNRVSWLHSEIVERNDFHSPEYLELINEITDLNSILEILGAAKMNEKIERTLAGLGFVPSDYTRQTNQFSGGWRMRIELAKILLKQPDLLLLDEPTNHLDIESIQWMEQFLAGYNGAVVIISHDRAFLDNITSRTIEISLGKIYDYKVSYSKYTALRNERRQQQLSAHKNQQKHIADINRFIERFRYKNTKAIQVQSRIKYLEKLERIEVDEEDASSIRIRFPAAPRSGNIVIDASNITKNYGEKNVLEKVDLAVRRGERVAFVGKNGEGKTTLSRILAGNLDFTGDLKIGHKVQIGYFAQNQDELLEDKSTVINIIDMAANWESRTALRSILGAFLFGDEDIDKKVKVLSGGERSRLALIKLLLEPSNLLILDEPTNHLDMRSKDILKQALESFTGTMILVSHDRQFLDGLIDTVYEFKDHKIKKYIGSVNDFLEKKKIDSLRQLEIKQKAPDIVAVSQAFSIGRESYQGKKEFQKTLRRLTKKIADCEESIEQIEKQIIELTGRFDSTATDYSDPESRQLFTRYERIKKELDDKMHEWEQLHAQLSELNNNNRDFSD